MNLNVATFYFTGCCRYRGRSGVKGLMLYHKKYVVPPTLNTALNLTDSVNNNKHVLKNRLAVATMAF